MIVVDDVHDWGNLVQGAARQYGTNWCHMFVVREATLTARDSANELHGFAASIGLRRSWASDRTQPQSVYLHYDLTPTKRRRAIMSGAVIMDWHDEDLTSKLLRLSDVSP